MKLMKKIPGGTLLVPMMISALIHTFFPDLFKIGGVTESFFGPSSLGFILGATIFISGCTVKLSSIKSVVKIYGLLILVRTAVTALFAILFFKFFGMQGVLGISLIGFICTLTSLNPSLFLAIMEDCGDEVDMSAFGFISLFATPAIAMLIFGLSQPTSVDYMSIVSLVIPLVLGVAIGNIDKDLGKFISTGMPFMIFALGWSVGNSIDLFEAVKAGFSGVIMAVVYYILIFLPMLFVERKVLKRDGVSAGGLSTIAGLSASIPMIMAANDPSLTVYAPRAAAIVTFGVIISSFVSPFLCNKLYTGEKQKEENK
ncbi:MAG: 2-keto-3-deoxygluconate permease [Finegoldia magna]|uniref:2-keto-3-deoxygluconate permease n=2 Tax=Finegoldia magna TaxID=1260 RepID=A0A2N6SQY7_FINMA|nr:2-keto-3-deoxygluconate permease [Finegoldia magna]EFH93123.1 putative 2-keto-3-deoxygluconate transporter [Finegoldia magna ATCC 53516]MBS5359673.1 2-keto-3-deoxygluconate permease [Finegoldia magna]MDU2638738.1 2-keto-3-deoxygluconate permease [Finegoldia magna]MDU7385158.1 2-keto-3-deoxygluconate permease [Finegoldia magna]PMC59446.1 2-keto-3-deoxygluconate permease [Finegoldia magna]